MAYGNGIMAAGSDSGDTASWCIGSGINNSIQ